MITAHGHTGAMTIPSPSSAVGRRLHHITLPVGDLEVAERFYVDVIGLPLAYRYDRAALVRLVPERAAEIDADSSALRLVFRCGEVELDLFLQRDLAAGPLRPHPHYAFAAAPDDIDRLRERLVAAGAPVDGPRRLGPPGQASLYFADPFGNLLEFATDTYPGAVPIGPPDLVAMQATRGG